MKLKKGDKNIVIDWKNEDFVLRAVVLAESFNQRFLPITHEIPRTLLTLFNGKIIDYTLNCLVNSGITEILVVVCSHAEIIKQHIMKSEILARNPTVNVVVTTVAQGVCDSIGDAMRELEQNYKQMVSHDFVLLTGFMISTINLEDLVKQHKEYRKIYKNNIMTILFKNYELFHRNSDFEATYFTLTDKKNSKLIYMKQFSMLNEGIPYSYLQFNKNLEASCNLHPTGVYICSPIVPQLFVDNFDFQGLNCLIHNVLNRDQILFDFSINYIVLKNTTYLSNINTLNSYFNTIIDLINRWSYPLTLESQGYKLHKNLVYFGENCTFNRTLNAPKKMVISKKTVVGKDSFIQQSYIGSNCVVGNNVTILDSIIWDNVTIGDNSTIYNTFVADGVIIGSNVKILPGCIVSFNCIIPSDVEIAKYTCLMIKNDIVAHDSLIDMPYDEKSTTKIYKIPDHLKEYYLWGACKQPFNELCHEHFQNAHLNDSLSDNSSDDFNDDQAKFSNEVHDSILFGLRDCLPSEAIILELNASKHAYNIPIEDMLVYIAPTCLNIMLNMDTNAKKDDIPNKLESSPKNISINDDDDVILANYKRIFPTVKDLIYNYTREDELQRSLLDIIENYFYQCSSMADKLNLIKYHLKFVHDLYQHDILDDYNIVDWHKFSRDQLTKFNKLDCDNILKYRQKNIGKFIDWLQQASEESDDDQ